MSPVFTVDANVAIAPMVDQFAVPVRHVRRCIKPQTDPLRTDPWHHDCEELFFALEPALAEILEAPFKDQVVKAEAALFTMKDSFDKYRATVTSFNSLPWWKRAYRAIRYGIN
jgi:hypothetical protein